MMMMGLFVLLALIAILLLVLAGDQAIRGESNLAQLLAILGAAVALADLVAILGHALWRMAVGG